MNAPHDPDWDLYRSFGAVLREGSLSAAARALGLTQPTLTRHIDTLETALGLPLFTRSQRGLIPTEAARELAPYADNLAATVAALRRAAGGQGGAVRGAVRVTASEVVGAEILPPILADLQQHYPDLVVELVLSNRVDNLLRRDADIAVRMVEPQQEALLVRRVGAIGLGLFAHRRYAARYGLPGTQEQLNDHRLIGFDQETPLIRAGRQALPFVDNLRFRLKTDSDLATLAAIRCGYGIGICQQGIAARDPDLLPVLPGLLDALPLPTWVVMHEDQRTIPRCRAVFDALVSGLQPWMQE